MALRSELSAVKPGVTVLYIMGLWRSGSTILDIVLGNHDQLESVGELRSLAPNGWSGHEICSCGLQANDCSHWRAVHENWVQRFGADRTSRLVQLQDRFERIRSFPRVITGQLLNSRAFREYSRMTAELYAAIADVGRKRIVVDSTKYPARAFALLRNPGIRLQLIHLVRDGRAVTWSVRRKPNVDLRGELIEIPSEEVALRTAQQWVRVNLFSDIVARLAGERAIRIRYEDLVSSPRGELDRIGNLLGVDFSMVSDQLAGGEPLEISHMIAGNRVRHAQVVRLRPDMEWRERLSDADRRVFWRRAGWLAQRYGYRK